MALLGVGYGVSIEQPSALGYEVTLVSADGDQCGTAATLTEAFRQAFHAPLKTS
jgi:hypothetical protein